MHAKKKIRKNISCDRLSSNTKRWIDRKEIVKIETGKGRKFWIEKEREWEREREKPGHATTCHVPRRRQPCPRVHPDRRPPAGGEIALIFAPLSRFTYVTIERGHRESPPIGIVPEDYYISEWISLSFQVSSADFAERALTRDLDRQCEKGVYLRRRGKYLFVFFFSYMQDVCFNWYHGKVSESCHGERGVLRR